MVEAIEESFQPLTRRLQVALDLTSTRIATVTRGTALLSNSSDLERSWLFDGGRSDEPSRKGTPCGAR